MSSRHASILAAVALVVTVATAIVVTRPTRWQSTSIEAIATTDRIDARRVRLTRGDTAFEATTVRFERDRVAARLLDVAEGQTLADVAGEATLAINGGYFDAAFAPLGLYRVDGRDVSPSLSRPPLSGVVTIDAAGRLDVVPRDDVTAIASARSAFQAGPFLIDPGGAIGIRGDDGKLAERTVLARDARSIVVIVTTPVTLAALATCLRDRPDAFGVDRVDCALNLDGGPSTGFVLKLPGVARTSLPRGRIRCAIAFTLNP